jgi:hypothetical protein
MLAQAKTFWERQNTQSLAMGFFVGVALIILSDGDAFELLQISLAVLAFAAVFAVLSRR